MNTQPHSPIDLPGVRARIDAALDGLLAERSNYLVSLSPDLAPVAAALADFCRGGKRIRPLFAYCGWRAAYGVSAEAAVIDAIASLELVQTAALIHDDIIDESDSRRGRPSLHRAFEEQHRIKTYCGDGAKHGVAVAILVGDLALILADALLHGAGLNDAAVLRARREFDLMRIEVMSGQYLDVLEQARPAAPERAVESALRVAELKSASYTVARPMLLGAAIADASADIKAAYATFGHHVGIAYQLRDDLLGVYGDPAVTGKPAGDDLREGKRTVLVARALSRLGDQSSALTSALGRPDLRGADIDGLRSLIERSGAVRDIETLISDHSVAAREALSRVDLDPAGRAALDAMVDAATSRAH